MSFSKNMKYRLARWPLFILLTACQSVLAVQLKSVKLERFQVSESEEMVDCKTKQPVRLVDQGFARLLLPTQADPESKKSPEIYLGIRPSRGVQVFLNVTGSDGRSTKQTLPTSKDGVISLQFPLGQDRTETGIPLLFQDKEGGEIDSYVRLHFVTPDSLEISLVALSGTKNYKTSCLRPEFWLGLGGSLFSFDQALTRSGTEARFASLSFPSIAFDAKYDLNPEWGVISSFHLAPGKIDTGEVESLREKDFQWNIFTIEVKKNFSSLTRVFSTFEVKPFMKGGFQRHSLPILILDENSELSLETAEYINAHIGLGIRLNTESSLFLETFLNHQFKILSQRFRLRPQMMVNGSIGAGFRLTERLALGLFWHGQWHRAEYEKKDSSASNLGKIDYLFSNLDLKVGWIF